MDEEITKLPETLSETGGENTNSTAVSAAAETSASVPIAEISRETIEQHVSASGPKKRGPKPKLKSYPPANGGITGGNLRGNDQAPGNSAAVQNQQAVAVPFDEKTAETLIEGGIEVFHGLVQTAVKAVCKKHNCTDEETKQALLSVAPTEKAIELLKKGGVGTMKKRSIVASNSPETLIWGGLIVWGASIFLTYRAVVGEKSQPEAEQKK